MMSPPEISALLALLSVLRQFSGWPFGIVIFVIVIGPWLLHFILSRLDSRRDQKREELHRKQMQTVLEQYRKDVSEIKRLYESNARLVTATNEAFKRLEKIYGESVSVISLNTQTQTNLVNAIENNRYSQIVRSKGAPQL
jgi:uncharacterized membrane-anchored protein YhcB (DUF1043 family)